MKKIWSFIKPYLRWLILGGTLFFLAKTLKTHWQEVANIRIQQSGWGSLAIAFSLSLLAYALSAWVWSWILKSFQQPINSVWIILVYLKTNLAKYLPGNFWHYYGRISAVTAVGGSLEAATVSVLLEIPLMAGAALLITLIGNQQPNWVLQVLCLAVVLLIIHPRILNPLIQILSRIKGKAGNSSSQSSAKFQIKQYPLIPLLGELGFLGLRGTAFLLTFMALISVNPSQIPLLFSVFSICWLMGMIVPGAPGGLGVFEATAIALLTRHFSVGLILSVVALFRLVTILAEVTAAGLAVSIEHFIYKNKRFS